MNDKLKCCAQVSGTGSFGWLHKSNCQRPVKVTVDGKHYCATHSPEAKAKRAKASEDRYNAKNAAYEAERQAQKEQAHKAACFDELVQALDKLVKRGEWTMDQSATHDGLTNCDALAQARRALDKATNV